MNVGKKRLKDMKIVSIINISKGMQFNIDVTNTIYASHIEFVNDHMFNLQSQFFDFVETIIGKNKLGNIEDCKAIFIDIDNVENPMITLAKMISNKLKKDNDMM